MPLRSVKMKRFILGFQRLVWCPKWTPLSSSCLMVTTAMAVVPPDSVLAPAGWPERLAPCRPDPLHRGTEWHSPE